MIEGEDDGLGHRVLEHGEVLVGEAVGAIARDRVVDSDGGEGERVEHAFGEDQLLRPHLGRLPVHQASVRTFEVKMLWSLRPERSRGVDGAAVEACHAALVVIQRHRDASVEVLAVQRARGVKNARQFEGEGLLVRADGGQKAVGEPYAEALKERRISKTACLEIFQSFLASEEIFPEIRGDIIQGKEGAGIGIE